MPNMTLLATFDNSLAYEDGGAGGTFTESGTAYAASTYFSSKQGIVVDSTDLLYLGGVAGSALQTLIPSTTGAVAVRFRRDAATTNHQEIVSIGNPASGTDTIRLFIEDAASDPLRLIAVVGTTYGDVIYGGNTTVSSDHFGYAEWDGTAIGVALDDGALATGTRSTPTGNWSSAFGLAIGVQNSTNSLQLGGMIDAIAFFDAPLTNAERLYLDGVTTPWTFGMALAPSNNAPTVDAGADATITAGDTLTRTVSFIDPDADTWTATVDYDEGAGPVAATVNQGDKTVALSNLYETAGAYTVTVVVSDGTDTGQDTFAVTVNEAPPEPTSGSYIAGTVAGTDTSAPTVTFTS